MPAADLGQQFDLDVAMDTSLATKARQAVDHYIQEQQPESGGDTKRWPITHNQIKGLRQVACHQPERLADFVEKQLAKAQAKVDEEAKAPSPKQQAIIAFWKLLKQLLQSPELATWSLAHVRSEAMPKHLRPIDTPKGAKLGREEKEARGKQKKERDRWTHAWDAIHIPPYFRSFCIHYLYRMYNG